MYQEFIAVIRLNTKMSFNKIFLAFFAVCEETI